MPLRDIPDLERRLRRLEMEADQRRHKLVVPERTVRTSLPTRESGATTSAWQTFDDIIATGWAAGGTPPSLEYLTVGDVVFCRLYVSGNSNGTTATVTLPYKAKTSGTTNHFRGAITEGRNGGSSLTTPGHWVIVSGGDVLTAYTAMPAGAWTASGVKSINISFWYAKE